MVHTQVLLIKRQKRGGCFLPNLFLACTASSVEESGPLPTRFLAQTLNRYLLSRCRPLTQYSGASARSVDIVHVLRFMSRLSTTYDKILLPPSLSGSSHAKLTSPSAMSTTRRFFTCPGTSGGKHISSGSQHLLQYDTIKDASG